MEETITGVVNARRKMIGSADRWVPGSVRGREEEGYRFGMFTGPRLVSVLGRDSSPRPFLFLFFFSSFLLFFF
jgi:hypothetical protein